VNHSVIGFQGRHGMAIDHLSDLRYSIAEQLTLVLELRRLHCSIFILVVSTHARSTAGEELVLMRSWQVQQVSCTSWNIAIVKGTLNIWWVTSQREQRLFIYKLSSLLSSMKYIQVGPGGK